MCVADVYVAGLCDTNLLYRWCKVAGLCGTSLCLSDVYVAGLCTNLCVAGVYETGRVALVCAYVTDLCNSGTGTSLCYN
jgi:hypothetical protein